MTRHGMARVSPLILAALMCAAIPSPASTLPVLSENATVSLLTMWPGNEIYLAFGHSALRIRDPAHRMDLIFNYGTFDFRDPLFIPKFVKGYLNYFLAYYAYGKDLAYDIRTQNRAWYEQVLNLDQDQVNALFVFLMDNARPENRFYRYDFILDNCATRIRDALLTVLGPDLRYDPDNVKAPRKSYRQMIDEFVADRPFFRFMFYPVLGMAADREVTSFGSQFLPLYMMKVFESSTISRNGTQEPLVRSAARVYGPATTIQRGKAWSDPSFVIWPCAVVVLFFTIRNILRLRKHGALPARRAVSRWLDALFFFVLGLMGCLVFYLTVFSVHAAAKENLSVAWLLPTNLVAAFFLPGKKGMPRTLSWYFMAVAALCVVPLLAWPVWPQRMHPTMIPLMLTIAARALWLFLSARTAPRAARPTPG
jgi:hypothetical protein